MVHPFKAKAKTGQQVAAKRYASGGNVPPLQIGPKNTDQDWDRIIAESRAKSEQNAANIKRGPQTIKYLGPPTGSK